jgi:hypothetical protein
MTERKFYISVWPATPFQGDSPPYPRRPWYSPFRSDQICRECAAQGDVVAIQRVNAHDAGRTNA